jgi:1-acyl-sn-glycerol-3-phosphate acyltransferase
MTTKPSVPPATLRDYVRSAVTFAVSIVLFYALICLNLLATTFWPARRVHFLMRFAGWLLVKVAGISLRVRGLEHIPRSGGFLLVCNHVNTFDPLILYAVIPRHCIAIEKAAHFRWFLYGKMIERWGNLPVESGNPTLSAASLDRAAVELVSGTPVFIYPEGTRARTGQLGPFKKGGFHLALRTRVPLIPMVFKGADKIFLQGTPLIRPGTEDVVLLPPVDLSGYRDNEAQRLADDVRELIRAELER